jgi:hypothetical protein
MSASREVSFVYLMEGVTRIIDVLLDCPHGAFQDPRTADSANARVSIDVAALVVY